MKDYQLIIIGSGPGGYAAALRAAELGLRTAVIEKGEPGGTCVNRGCVPTKALLHVSDTWRRLKGAAGIGLCAAPGPGGQENEAEFIARPGAIFAYKESITDRLSHGVEDALKKAGVDLIHARAVISGPHCVELYKAGATEECGSGSEDGGSAVTAESGSAGTAESGCADTAGIREKIRENDEPGSVSGAWSGRLTADFILIATGSEPFVPGVPGIDLPGVMDSDEILKGQENLFRTLVIVGGGVIGVELAVFYSDMGCGVTIIEGLDRLLPGLDRELGQNLALILKKQGVKILTGTMLKSIEQGADGGVRVHGESKGREITVEAQACLCAIGRKPYTRGLFAEELSPSPIMERGRIVVDEFLRTSLEGVFAIGDVSGRIQLAHAATAQGMAAAQIIAGECRKAARAGGTPAGVCDSAGSGDVEESGAVEGSGAEGNGTGTAGTAPGLRLPDGTAPDSHLPGGTVNLELVPSCIYCRPEIASVGLCEAEAKKAGRAVRVGKCVMFANARTMIEDPGRCFMKLVADAGSGELLGGQLMCPDASDMISEISLAIANHLTVDDMLKVMRPHPTFEEALTEALRDLKRKLEH